MGRVWWWWWWWLIAIDKTTKPCAGCLKKIVMLVRTKVQYNLIRLNMNGRRKASEKQRERFQEWKASCEKKNVFTMKCKNLFIINMNNYHLLRVLKAKHSAKSVYFANRQPNTEYRRVNTEKNSAQHTKESCNMNSLAQQCWHLFANII